MEQQYNQNNRQQQFDDEKNDDDDDLTLFIGGSSCLGRTYVNLLEDENNNNDDGFFITNNQSNLHQRPRRKRRLLLSGSKETPPKWISSSRTSIIAGYIHVDLTNLTKDTAKELLDGVGYGGRITRIIIGVRPILFAKYDQTEYCKAMIQGIQTLLECFCDNDNNNDNNQKFVLHLSSVAAVDHMREQSYQSEENNSSSSQNPIPPIEEYKASYDIFKFQCEEVISNICSKAKNIRYCHLRLSAIFSDDPNCIQCSALGLQSRIGCYLPNPIDCNSSRNVSRAISAILSKAATIAERNEEQQQNMKSSNGGNNPTGTTNIHSLYYYTRPLHLKRPVPYGYYLQAYRNAYGIDRYSIWIPVWIVTGFVSAFHWIANKLSSSSTSFFSFFFHLPYIDSADYLLQVSAREHSFDNSRFANDFGSNLFLQEEESIFHCFIRRRRFLSTTTTSFKNNNDNQKAKSI